MLVMDKNLEPQSMVNVSDLVGTKTGHKEKSYKCSQCDYAAVHASGLRTHFKMHTGERSNKCNQCDYIFFQAGNLREYLITLRGKIKKNAASLIISCSRASNSPTQLKKACLRLNLNI